MSRLVQISFFLSMLLIILSSFISAIDTQDPKINVTLSKNEYSSKETIIGDIDFEFTAPVENHEIIAEIGNINTKIKLIDALDKKNIDYEATDLLRELYGDLSTGISFPPNKQLIGFLGPYKVPKSEILVNNVQISNLGATGTSIKFPYIDLGADGKKEWIFLGGITDWKTQYITSGLLNKNDNGKRTVRRNDYYCATINIGEEVERVNVSVRYSPENNIPVYVQALGSGIRPPGTINFEEFGRPDDVCELSRNISPEWSSCVLEFHVPRIRNSDTMFCVFTDEPSTGTLYILDQDNKGGRLNRLARTADCRLAANNESFACTEIPQHNYFIKINLPEYDGLLEDRAQFSDHLISTIGSFEKKIEIALSDTSCNPDELSNCIVPIEVGSQSSGLLSIPGNLIEIRDSTVTFQQFRITPEILTKIKTKDLTKKALNLTLPLTIFDNLTTPEVSQARVLSLETTFGSRNMFTDVFIEPTTIEQTANLTISGEIERINDYLSDTSLTEVLAYLELDLTSKKTTLESLRDEIADIELNTTMNEQNKTYEKNRIRTQASNLVNDVPEELFVLHKVAHIPSIPPTQILDLYLPEGQRTDKIKNYVLGIQNKATIDSEAIAYKLKTRSGVFQERTLIIRDISTSLSNAFVIEDIPSTVATVTNIEYKDPVKVLQGTSTLKLSLHLGSAELTYQINGDVTDKLSNLRTLVVTTEGISTDEFEEPTCGDGICIIPLEDKILCPQDCKRKIPWLPVILVLVIFFILIFYINFYKGKYSFQSLFYKKKLFKTEADKLNLINYIERAKAHASIERVKKILYSKGWTKEQVDYAFKRINKRKPSTKQKPSFLNFKK